MPNYAKSCFYKVVCNDLTIKDLYVGHTTNFTKRKAQHKHSCNNPERKDYNYNVYRFIRANSGWSNWNMVLIVERSCNNSLEAHAIEREYYNLLGATLNKQIPNQTDVEYNKVYYEQNKEAIKAYQNEKHTCCCGVCYTTQNKARHLRTIKHKQYIESIAQNI